MQPKQTETRQKQSKQSKFNKQTKSNKQSQTIQTQRSTGKNERTKPNGVGSKTGSTTNTKQAMGKTGRQLGNKGRTTGVGTGERRLGNERYGAAAGRTRRLGRTGPGQTRGGTVLAERLGITGDEAATELAARNCGTATGVTGLEETGKPATEATELERTGETATEATGQLDWTAGAAPELVELTAGTEPEPDEKQGEDRSAKSIRGRDRNGQGGKQSGSHTYLGTSMSARPHVEAATDEDGREDKTDETAHGADLMVGRDNSEAA